MSDYRDRAAELLGVHGNRGFSLLADRIAEAMEQVRRETLTEASIAVHEAANFRKGRVVLVTVAAAAAAIEALRNGEPRRRVRANAARGGSAHEEGRRDRDPGHEAELALLRENFAEVAGDARDLLAERDRLRAALERIAAVQATEVPYGAGPEDMEAEAKRFCRAFGECISIAREALRHAG